MARIEAMKTDKKVIQLLNGQLKHELTAIISALGTQGAGQA
jgi:hypothetical protein